MQVSADAIAAYCFVFLILVIYTADAVIQWRNPQERSKKYLFTQLSIIVAFFIAEVVLVVLSQENPKEVREAMLHSLQGLSLLQSLMMEAMVSTRLYLGIRPLDLRFRSRCYFSWVLCSVCIIAFAFGFVAFVFILQGVNDELSRLFVGTAVVTVHGFLACFSLRHLHDGHLKRKPVGFYILCFNLASLPISVLVLSCSNITICLLAETSICFISNSLWVSLMLYNFEIKKSIGDRSTSWKSLGSINSADDIARCRYCRARLDVRASG